MKAEPTDRFDALDTEAFEEMVTSRAFSVYRQRLVQALTAAGADCEREDSELRLRRAQGQAAALRMVLGLPVQILTEMRSKRK